MKSSILRSTLAITGVLTLLPMTVRAEVENDAQRLAHFKQIRQQSVEGRLNVLQQERACVQAAATMEALHSCEQVSHLIMEQMREQQKEGWESMPAGKHQEIDNKQ
jgi:hypothetical protein